MIPCASRALRTLGNPVFTSQTASSPSPSAMGQTPPPTPRAHHSTRSTRSARSTSKNSVASFPVFRPHGGFSPSPGLLAGLPLSTQTRWGKHGKTRDPHDIRTFVFFPEIAKVSKNWGFLPSSRNRIGIRIFYPSLVAHRAL